MKTTVSYTGTIWLLVTQLFVMLPFTLYLPVWLIPVLFFTAGWRIRVLKGHTEQPGTIIKVIMVITGLGALALSGLPFPSLDLMVSVLLLGFAFKTLEVVTRRDAVIVVFLGFFLVAVHFLYSQSMLAGLYGIISMIALTAALIGIHYPLTFMSTRQSTRHNLRLGAVMLLQCLPLMLLIFIFAPRLPPLFMLPLPSSQAKTGISDTMTPGDIASLSQSDDLAFRVTFKGEPPPQNQLYWRGLTLNHFDGRRWQQFIDNYEFRQLRQNFESSYRWQPDNMQIRGDAIEYEAIYESSGQPWLFTLTPTTEVYGDVVRGGDYRVMAMRELQAPALVKAVSYPDSQRDLELDPTVRRLALQLPYNTDPRTRQLAKELQAQSNSNQDYINRVLQRYRQQPFHYTLRPPTLGNNNTIDSFLFDSQRGFCAHYAGSFVFLMRAAGIPARIVTGYQGGEWNEAGQYLLVHQFDAHAWTEVWLPESGWQRIDPTTMVAPERVEQGLEEAMRSEGSFLENQLFTPRKIAWLNNLRKQIDTLQYGWRRFVLGYDQQSQADFLRSLFGQLSIQKIAIIMIALFASIGLFWVLLLGLNRSRDKLPPEQKIYQRFEKLLARQGIQRKRGQAPGDFARLAASRLPGQAEVIMDFNNIYEQICYASTTSAAQTKATKALAHQLKQLRSNMKRNSGNLTLNSVSESSR
ncbi:MAG: transglutaminase TgpA family protein [Thiolinea sp.]